MWNEKELIKGRRRREKEKEEGGGVVERVTKYCGLGRGTSGLGE